MKGRVHNNKDEQIGLAFVQETFLSHKKVAKKSHRGASV